MSLGGGGGGPQESTSTVTQTNLPEYAEPYVRDLLSRAATETSQPYQAYQGQRLAGFSPMEQEAMARYGQMGMSGTPEELNEAGRVAAGIAGAPMDVNISGSRGSSYGGPGSTAGTNYGAGSRQSGYTAGSIGSQYEASGEGPGNQYVAGQRQVGYDPGSLQNNNLEGYMDPYMQQVVDIQKREASRQADIRRRNTGLDAAGQGSLGGYREAIEQAETERNLMQQTGDIQAQGSQEAWRQALGSFEADRAANAQLEEFGQSQFGMNEGARQRQAELEQAGWSSEEAARQAQEEFRQSAWGMSESARQQEEQFGQSQFQMNESNKQFSAQLKSEMFRAKEQAKQRAAELGLRAEEIEQAGQIASQEAKIRLEQNRLQGAGMLGDFASQRQNMEYDRLGMMNQAGLSERGLMQQGLDIGYQDYLRQQAFPRENLSFYNDMIHGNQIAPGQTTATYGQGPTMAQQLGGMGIAGMGMYNASQGGGRG